MDRLGCEHCDGKYEHTTDCVLYRPDAVKCDDPKCVAIIAPVTEDELRDALDHWQHHGWLSGCSHGQ